MCRELLAESLAQEANPQLTPRMRMLLTHAPVVLTYHMLACRLN
jgi:hypothetical protein